MQWNWTLTTTRTLSDTDAAMLPAMVRRDETLVSAEIGVQTIIFVMALGGNGLVLGMLVAISRRKELGRMYTMIGHLSCADLFVAMFNLLPQVRIATSIIHSPNNDSKF